MNTFQGDIILSVLPVSLLTRKSFQSEYLVSIVRGGINGLPLVAHQPTGCTIEEHRLTQKSLLPLSPNPERNQIKSY